MAKGKIHSALQRVTEEIAFLTAVKSRLEAELNAKPTPKRIKKIDPDNADVRRAADRTVAAVAAETKA